MIAGKNQAVVVLDPGSPGREDEVEPFLFERFLDERFWPLPLLKAPFRAGLARRQAARLAETWRRDVARVGIDSPLERVARAQAHGIAERLGCEGYAAVLHGRPAIAETVALMRAEGIERALLLPIDLGSADFPARARADFERHWIAAGGAAADCELVTDLHRQEDVLRVLETRVAATLALTRDEGAPVLLLGRDDGPLGGRGAPAAPAQGLAEDLRRRLGLGERAFAARLPARWIDPGDRDEIAPLLERWRSEGRRELVVVPTAWLADRYETLYDVDMMLARRAREAGMRTYRVPSPNDEAGFLDALARCVQGHAGRGGAEEREA